MKKRILTIILVFVMVFATTITSFAASYSPPTAIDGTNDSYIIFQEPGKTSPTCIIYNSRHWSPYLEVYNSSGYDYYAIQWTKNTESPYVRYYSSSYTTGSSNGGWGTMSQYDSTTTNISAYKGSSIDTSRFNIIDSNQDWYWGSNLVFQKMGLEEVTVQSLEQMTLNLGGVMKTITLCGVGCLALLIGLHLLRQKSVLFLNR